MGRRIIPNLHYSYNVTRAYIIILKILFGIGYNFLIYYTILITIMSTRQSYFMNNISVVRSFLQS